jgi:hypothetical protein
MKCGEKNPYVWLIRFVFMICSLNTYKKAAPTNVITHEIAVFLIFVVFRNHKYEFEEPNNTLFFVKYLT